MAAEYEIKEVGFIGSLWRGQFSTPLDIGKTFEIANVPNTVNTGRNQSIFLTAKEDLDISILNKQVPDGFVYEIGKLSPDTVQDLFVNTKIDKRFLEEQTVLFRFDSRAILKNVERSKLPIQANWSFDSSDPQNAKYIYNSLSSITFANYVFLIDRIYQTQLISYFESLQQESFTIAFPPSLQPIVTDPLTVQPVLIEDIEKPLFGKLSINEDELETIALDRFEINFQLAESGAIPPDVDSLFIASTNEEINANLREINSRVIFIEEMIDNLKNTSTLPFTDERNMRIELIFLGLVQNYLLDKFRKLNDVGFPDEDPTRYTIDIDGNIAVLPRVISDPPPVIQLNDEINEELDQFDEFVDEIIENLEVDDNNVYSFKRISKLTDYDLPTLRYKTKGLFRCAGESLSSFYTASLTTKQQKYYLRVLNESEGTTDSYHQFDVTYCHISGSGSSHIEGEVDLYPAKTMYRKYMLECFGSTAGKFPFKNGINGDYFYVIQLDRDQFKEKLDPGNFELALCELSSSGTISHPTSNRLFRLIDESKDTRQEVVTNEGIQEYYYVTSGSLRDGVYNEKDDNAWGVIFPKMGLIILDGVVLDQSCSFSTITGSTDGQNAKRLFLSVSGAAVPTAYRPSGSFFARSFETFLTETYFCRANADEFNTSNNYTYVTGSDGFFKFDYFKSKPNSYITTIGLYNRKRELLAVGKLKNPILKNEGKVCIFEVVVRLN